MVVYRGKRSEYKQLQQEIQELQAKQEQLSRQINALRSDPRTIEKEAREQLRYARPGEVIYVFPPPTPEKPDTATAEKR
jgi:cell division protein FtsB